ncbi:unnamed protein product [Pleuronectes platessa]|uniref:Uncharacterized protein n=1 Tax=Pleuronectes platessa TaxID=8262 RepID=A0A9N7YC93_PLEPL|nr:unnamed protein product [Pleuronectes platessa]
MENLVDLLGQPADHMLAAGEYSEEFFILDKSGWRLMIEEFTKKHKEEPETDKSSYISFKEELNKKRISDEQDKLEFQDKMAFFDLLTCCLQVDPEQRISPSEALKHPFITMVHMVDEMETSSYADTALELMIVSPLGKIDESPFNTVTSEESTSISSNTGSAATITPVDVDDVNTSSQKPFKKKLFQRVKNFFCRVAKRVHRTNISLLIAPELAKLEKLEKLLEACMGDCPLDWWTGRQHTHEKLAGIAKKHLSTPAPKVPFEFRPQRQILEQLWEDQFVS